MSEPTEAASGCTRLPERLALVGEGERRAGVVAGLRDAPGDGLVVGDAHDQAALAAHQSGRHDVAPPA